MSKLGRNDPCSCGSGIKYKQCCLAKNKGKSQNLTGTFPSMAQSKSQESADHHKKSRLGQSLTTLFSGKEPKINQKAVFDRFLHDIDRSLHVIESQETRTLLKAIFFGSIFNGGIATHFKGLKNRVKPSEGPFDFVPVEFGNSDKLPSIKNSWEIWHSLNQKPLHDKFWQSLGPLEATFLGNFRQGNLALIELRAQDSAAGEKTGEQLAQIAQRMNHPDLKSCFLNLSSLGSRCLLDDSRNLMNDSKVICINPWVDRSLSFKSQVTIAIVYDVAGLKLANADVESVIMDIEGAKYIQILLQMPGNKHWNLGSLYRSLSSDPLWHMPVSTRQDLWNAEYREAELQLWRTAIRLSSPRIAAIFAEKMQLAAIKNPQLEQILWCLQDPLQVELQDQFVKAWDYSRLRCIGNQASFPKGQHLLLALLGQSAAKIYKSRTAKSPTQKKKKSYHLHHRLRRSGFDPLTIKDYQLHKTALRLESKLQALIQDGDFALTVPKTMWSQSNSSQIIFDVDTNILTLPIMSLECEWELHSELMRWVVAMQLANIYRTNNPALSQEAAFELAAKRMALSKSFMQASPVLERMPSHWRENDANVNPEEKRILRKIDKLFALSQSSNEAEASLAMQRAQEMISSYNVSHYGTNVRQDEYSDMVQLTLYLDRKTEDPTTERIASLLIRHYYVRAIWGHAWNFEACDQYVCLHLIGRRHNVLLAEHVFDFLMYKVQNLWKEAAKIHTLQAKQRLSFQIGLLDGFSAKLKEIERNRKSASDKIQEEGLMALEENKVDDYLAELFPSLRHTSSSNRRLDPNSYHAGKQEGANIQIDRPISSDRGGGGSIGLLS